MGGLSATGRRWLLRILLLYAPWAALNVFWLVRGDLVSQPVWSVIINVCIAFFGIAAPAIDRRFEKRQGETEPSRPSPRPVPRPRRRAA